jgi:hypothetical protein
MAARLCRRRSSRRWIGCSAPTGASWRSIQASCSSGQWSDQERANARRGARTVDDDVKRREFIGLGLAVVLVRAGRCCGRPHRGRRRADRARVVVRDRDGAGPAGAAARDCGRPEAAHRVRRLTARRRAAVVVRRDDRDVTREKVAAGGWAEQRLHHTRSYCEMYGVDGGERARATRCCGCPSTPSGAAGRRSSCTVPQPRRTHTTPLQPSQHSATLSAATGSSG